MARPASHTFAQLVREHLPQLSQVIPELQAPLWMWTNSRRVAENTAFVDWDLTPDRNMMRMFRVVNEPSQLYGIDGRGKILWRCYGYSLCSDWLAIAEVARQRGFEIIDSTEFHTWLKKRMLNLVQAPASAGLPALEASLLRQLYPNQTEAIEPAKKAR